MIEFANNEFYELRVDKTANRMYITIKGFWREKGNYLEDLEEACKAMSPGFKIHVDLTTMKTPRQDVGEVHIEAQKLLMNYGLIKTAEVHGPDALARMAINKYSDNTGMYKQIFSSNEGAKKWLDESD